MAAFAALAALCLVRIAAADLGPLDSKDSLRKMQAELRDATRANAEAVAQAASEKQDREKKANHLARLTNEMTSESRELRDAHFKEAQEEFEAKRAHLRAVHAAWHPGKARPHVVTPAWRNTALVQASPDDAASLAVERDAKEQADQAARNVESPGAALVRTVKEQRQVAVEKAKLKASPLGRLVSDMGAGIAHVQQKTGTVGMKDIKEAQRRFDERRKQLLARPNSPARLRAMKAAAKKAKAPAALLQGAGPFAQRSAAQVGSTERARELVRRMQRQDGQGLVPKSQADREQDQAFDRQARQCVVEGQGCWDKFEGCAHDLCATMPQIQEEECFQKAVLSYRRLKGTSAEAQLNDCVPKYSPPQVQ